MGDVIDLAAFRRNKEIERSICFVGEERVDPIDEELNRRFVEHQRQEMMRAKGALHGVLESLTKLAAELRKEAEIATPSKE